MGTSRLVRRMLFFGFPNDLFHIFLLCCSLPCLSSCVVTLDCFLWSGCGGAAIGHRNEFMRSLPSPAQFNSLYNSVSIEPMSQRGKDPSDPFFFFFFSMQALHQPRIGPLFFTPKLKWRCAKDVLRLQVAFLVWDLH